MIDGLYDTSKRDKRREQRRRKRERRLAAWRQFSLLIAVVVVVFIIVHVLTNVDSVLRRTPIVVLELRTIENRLFIMDTECGQEVFLPRGDWERLYIGAQVWLRESREGPRIEFQNTNITRDFWR